MTMKLIHFTDTHLCLPGQTLYGTSPLERLNTCIDSINSEHNDADLCIITGDLAHRGEPAAYQQLDDALSRLRVPYQLVIGNHDDRDLLAEQFPTIERDANDFMQSAHQCAAGTLLLMDTVKAGTHAGAYCEQRQQWLAEQLEQAQGDIFLFMHHAPFKTGLKAMDQIGMDPDDRIALKRLIEAHGRVRHLFFGHYHRPITGTWAGMGFSTLRGMNHQTVLDMDNDQAVQINHEPPAYAIALLEPDQIVIHSHDFMDSSRCFVPADEPEWNKP
ncbi:MAG: Icc protein [Motiliproteus sp.]|jgi:Icc protein